MRKRAFRPSLESLEDRMLLCGDASAHARLAESHHTGLDVVAQHDADGNGHLTLGEYEALPATEQNKLDPHLIDDPRFDGPVDFDELLGVPKPGTGTEAPTLPDFFPQLADPISLDRTTQPGRNLLRFGTQVNNQGTGPAILISGRPGIDSIPSGAPITSWVNSDGSQNVLQAVYNFTNNAYSLAQYMAVGRFIYHTGHSHFHYDGYAYYRLRHNVGGQAGDYVQRSDGTGVIGEKVGFCLINIASSFTMENGQNSSTLPGYGRPGQPSTGCGLLQGVHVGKADIYSDGLQGQWIDVTGVPNGSYFLEIELDGEHALVETNDNNNAKVFPYNLNTNPPVGGISPDVYDTNTNNNTFDAATDMGVMGTFVKSGLTIHWGQDFDYFRFVASSSGTYTVTSSIADGNVDIYLYNSDRVQIGASTNSSGNESISYSFVAGQTYYVKAEAYNSTQSSNYQVAWNLKPLTTSTAAVALSGEDGRVGKFVINRNGPTTTGLTIGFTLSGTAINGVDYQLVSPSSLTMGTLQSSAEIEIIPISDSLVEGRETVILTILSSSAYVVGPTGSQIVIRDSGVPVPFTPHSQEGSTGDRDGAFGFDELRGRRRGRPLAHSAADSVLRA